MEIKVTHIINDEPDVYGSRYTHGNDAAKLTWDNALEYTEQYPTLKDNEYPILANYLREFGASWTDEELQDPTFLEAIFVQLVISDYKEGDTSRLWQDDEQGDWFYYVGL